jgi:hypothetical protein
MIFSEMVKQAMFRNILKKEAAFKDELQKIATPMGFKKAVLLKSCTAKDLNKEASPREIDVGMALLNRIKIQKIKGVLGDKAYNRIEAQAKQLTHPAHGVIRNVPINKPGTLTEGSKRRELIESVISNAQASTRHSSNVRGEIKRGRKLYQVSKKIESMAKHRPEMVTMPRFVQTGKAYA